MDPVTLRKAKAYADSIAGGGDAYGPDNKPLLAEVPATDEYVDAAGSLFTDASDFWYFLTAEQGVTLSAIGTYGESASDDYPNSPGAASLLSVYLNDGSDGLGDPVVEDVAVTQENVLWSDGTHKGMLFGSLGLVLAAGQDYIIVITTGGNAAFKRTGVVDSVDLAGFATLTKQGRDNSGTLQEQSRRVSFSFAGVAKGVTGPLDSEDLRVPSGATAGRTSTSGLASGETVCYFDTDLGKPIWWDGSGWVDATGTSV